MNLASFVNGVLSSATVATQLLTLFFCVLLFSRSARESLPRVMVFLKKRALVLSFCAALVALLGSLTYSDVLGYEPCKLCWIQRIFMYPQVLILGVALWKKDMSAFLYGIVFSSIGGIVALYHYMTQLGWNPLNLPCAAVGYSTSCAKVFVLNLGYITIPLMAFSVFAFIFTLTLIAYKGGTSSS